VIRHRHQTNHSQLGNRPPQDIDERCIPNRRRSALISHCKNIISSLPRQCAAETDYPRIAA
jgi:hypothetical protein